MENTGYQYGLDNEYDEIDLRELIMEIWSNKWAICLITFLFILVATIYSFFIADPVYESSSEIYTPDFNLVNGSTIKNDEYFSFFYTPEIKRELIGKYNLETSLEDMDRKITIKNSIENNNTVLLIKDTDRVLAAELLNDWVRLFSIKVKSHIDGLNSDYMGNLKELVLEREGLYQEAKKAWTEFEAKNNPELLKSRLSNSNHRLVELENRVNNLRNEISVLSKKERVLVDQLQNTEKLTVTKVYLSDSSLEKLINLFDESGFGEVNIEKENINEQYMTIQGQLNKTTLDLAGKNEELRFIEEEIVTLRDDISSLKNELAVLEEKERSLKTNFSDTERYYQDIVNDYNSAVNLLQKRSYNIPVIIEAVVPENPVSPRKLFNLAIAGVLGLFVSLFLVFMKKYLVEDKSAVEIGQ